MISSFLAWFIIGIVAYLCGKSIHKAYVKDIAGTSSITSGYIQGYLAGVTNVKMYYYIMGSMPSTNWLDANRFKTLKDRESLLKTIDTATKRGVGILDE